MASAFHLDVDPLSNAPLHPCVRHYHAPVASRCQRPKGAASAYEVERAGTSPACTVDDEERRLTRTWIRQGCCVRMCVPHGHRMHTSAGSERTRSDCDTAIKSSPMSDAPRTTFEDPCTADVASEPIMGQSLQSARAMGETRSGIAARGGMHCSTRPRRRHLGLLDAP